MYIMYGVQITAGMINNDVVSVYFS